MALSLTHLGESIFAAMINGQRESFLTIPGLSGLANLEFVRSARQVAFCEAQLGRFGNRAFDGACRIDVAVQLKADMATAFELKLGTTRLTPTRVNDEWLLPCAMSHRGQRWTGNIMAVLERNFPEPVAGQLAVRIGDDTLPLTREWFIVARKETVALWHAVPPKFSEFVRLLAFEDVVERFGGQEYFNRLVRGMLDVDFYREWVLRESDSG
jgi:hypothetical protein